MDPAYAERSATGKYRTTPLRGLLQHPPYFHDGSAPDLPAVVNHYDALFGLNLTPIRRLISPSTSSRSEPCGFGDGSLTSHQILIFASFKVAPLM
jgi:hypothetical protein